VQLTRATFDELRRLVHGLCGLVLSEEKEYLVRHRLGPVARAAGCRCFEEFAQKLRGPDGPALHDAIVAAITTGETSFFRDGHPFEAFRRHLPRLAERARGRLAGPGGVRVRLWCAATSTGQEPYSLAMLLDEWVGTNPGSGVGLRDFSILASDVSARVLAAAAVGEYSDRELARGLTPGQLRRHFEPQGERWRLREPLRRLVAFRRLNLVRSLPALGRFDVIFCRNVMIYFDEATRRRVVDQFAAVLEDGGWLMLGAAENLYGVSDRFESVRDGETLVYVKRCFS
jgi:chemotaxis protein methyltransferase CheR